MRLLGFLVIAIALLTALPAGACPVTRPQQGQPLGERASRQHYGRRLWTVLPPGGRLVVVPWGSAPAGNHVAVDRIASDGSIAVKFPWWGDATAARGGSEPPA